MPLQNRVYAFPLAISVTALHPQIVDDLKCNEIFLQPSLAVVDELLADGTLGAVCGPLGDADVAVGVPAGQPMGLLEHFVADRAKQVGRDLFFIEEVSPCFALDAVSD